MMNKLKILKGQVLKEFGDKESLASLARIILKESDWREDSQITASYEM